MNKQHGPWTIHESLNQYQNPFFTVREDQVTQPDGEPGQYGVVTLKSGVLALPIDADGYVYLTRQFRYALGRDSIEVASGSIDADEDEPRAAAARELREELGIEAQQWEQIGIINLDTSIVQCTVYLFLARDLLFTETEQEGTEDIAPLRMSFAEALQLVLDGTITHSASCVLLLKAHTMDNL